MPIGLVERPLLRQHQLENEMVQVEIGDELVGDGCPSYVGGLAFVLAELRARRAA